MLECIQGISDTPIVLRLAFHVGDVVRKLRETRGWTQDRLAAETGLNKNAIVRFERQNYRRGYKSEVLTQIARALETEPSEILETAEAVSSATAPMLPITKSGDDLLRQAGAESSRHAGSPPSTGVLEPGPPARRLYSAEEMSETLARWFAAHFTADELRQKLDELGRPAAPGTPGGEADRGGDAAGTDREGPRPGTQEGQRRAR